MFSFVLWSSFVAQWVINILKSGNSSDHNTKIQSTGKGAEKANTAKELKRLLFRSESNHLNNWFAAHLHTNKIGLKIGVVKVKSFSCGQFLIFQVFGLKIKNNLMLNKIN